MHYENPRDAGFFQHHQSLGRFKHAAYQNPPETFKGRTIGTSNQPEVQKGWVLATGKDAA